ncbi:MAG TPA: histidine--tRNA ligase [Melioribacteraceae bacterium]|nr:histidine--tRNA ligase [Melioribacteraceae bacterium]
MIKAVTGTKDILPDDIEKWYLVENLVREIFKLFNYKEIRTPVFEETALFSRGIGEATDIVSKEMYTFLDRSELSLTLKPEMTASVVRAFIEHSLDKKNNLNKLFYISPMFRQERPQAGRFRQFHQFGAEALGSNDPLLDAEMIIMAYTVFKNLGLKNVNVKINSLGEPNSREIYKKELHNYLSDKIEKLSEDSKRRIDINILRIFDSKELQDIEIMKNAPVLLSYIDEQSLNQFEEVKKCLLNNNIPFEVDTTLVRGLDYYTNTTFEVVSGSVGSQSALCGGGRYNLLIEQLGGKPTPGVGFAAGIERLLLACENENCLNLPNEKIDVYVVRLDNELKHEAYNLCLRFRSKGIISETDYAGRSIKAQMREANKYGSKFVLFLGGDEYKQNKVVLKNMYNSEQTNFDLNEMEQIEKLLCH